MFYLSDSQEFCFNFNNQQVIDALIDRDIPYINLADDMESAYNMLKTTDIEFVFFPLPEELTQQDIKIDFSNLTFYKAPFLDMCATLSSQIEEIENSENNIICAQNEKNLLTHSATPETLDDLADYFQNLENEGSNLAILYDSYVSSIQDKLLKLGEGDLYSINASKNNKIVWHFDDYASDPLMLVAPTERGTIFCSTSGKEVDKTAFDIKNQYDSGEKIRQEILSECKFYETPKDYAVIFKQNTIHAIPEVSERLIFRFEFPNIKDNSYGDSIDQML